MAIGLIQKLIRRKYIPADQVCATTLNRCLSTLDLTALGIGSTLGLGVYVMAGEVAKRDAGPSVTISFLIAAIASVFAGLCYAEFGARVPRTGSAYVYSYVTVGELIAFIIGWNLVLEYVIGTASVAAGYSGYINYLTNYAINDTLTREMPMYLSWLSPYPDFLAFGITILLAGVLSIGVKESSIFNNVCTLINLAIVAFVIICGAVKADPHNWKIPKSEVPPDEGDGGFFPYGISGMMSGAATCFYGFVGFDCIATTGEEVRNPQRAIPISIILSLLFIFMAYFGISTVLTLMIPYYAQNTIAPLPYAFEVVGWQFAKWFVSIGALAGLSTSLLGAMFPLPRILYAMAKDGLIFRWLGRIHPRYKTPVLATLVAGFIAALMAMLFSLKELMDMMSIGTLMAYTLVAASVLVLRYQSTDESENDELSPSDNKGLDIDPIMPSSASSVSFVRQYFNIDRLTSPTESSQNVAKVNVVLLGVFSSSVAITTITLSKQLIAGDWWAIILVAFFAVVLITVLISLGVQPQNDEDINFKVPCVPLIPALSIFINVYLMLKLSYPTWIRFSVWLGLGMLIYGLYGIKESNEEYRRKGIPHPE